MTDEKMKYPSMDDMTKAFKEAHQQLEESMREMKKLANMMERGALVGDGGTAFQAVINAKLLERAMKPLHEKMGQLADDIDGAVVANREGVNRAKSRFA